MILFKMKEGCERIQKAIDIGAEQGHMILGMMVLIADLEASFTGDGKEYTIVGHKVDDYPEGFKRISIEDRL